MRLIDGDAIYPWYTDTFDFGPDEIRFSMYDIRDNLYDIQTVQQWILCSERLPDKGLRVLMCLNNAWQIVGWYDKEDKQWYTLPFSLEVVNNCVLAWMPLPPCYEPQESEESE